MTHRSEGGTRTCWGQTSRQTCVGGDSCGADSKDDDGIEFECQFCQTMNDERMYDCQIFQSFWGSTQKTIKTKNGLKRLVANVALRIEFAWRYTTRRFLSKAREETKTALTRSTRPSRRMYQHHGYSKDKMYADRMDLAGMSTETMQEWDALYEKRERSPLPVQRAP